nr:hypothetical protein [Tanacetum cinerariifolium]
MDQPNPTFAKILILDTGKFKQWKFRIQQYLQNEHYALWEVIEFGDSYKAPQEEAASESSTKRKGRTVVITTEDMQKRRNDVKARTTLLLDLPDEHQLRFSKYETAKELWEAILKTFGGNEATKKTKKNQLKQQYGNFKAEGSETLEQTFNRLQAIVSHLEFMDVEIEQDDLNQEFFTSLAPEWLMYTIVWRNRDDIDTMTNTSSGKGEVHTASVPTASTKVSTVSADVAAASISHDTVCAYIASQSNGSQIKYKDITQIDEDDIEEMDIKWNMALQRWSASIATRWGHFARECRAPRSQDRGRRETYKQGSKEEEPVPKALMVIDGIGWDWSYMANEEENHALVADDEAPTELVLMVKLSSSSENEVEARLVEFKTQEIKFCEKIRGLEFDVEYEPYDGGYVSFGQGGGKITGKDFKLKDDTNVLLRTPRQHNMYSIDLNNIVPHKDLTCLVAKASADKSMLWHRRLGKQHKASCKTKLVNSVSKPLHTLHIDLFGPTFDETSGILRNFITEIENLKDLKVKIIRCDNGGEFKNKEMNEFYTRKGIKREFSNARTLQQNRVAEKRNTTLIKAARTMLADAKLPVTFWAEAVNTACYVQNRVIVNKSQNKTPYELFSSRTLDIGFLRPFKCHVMILNTLDHLGKFDAKGDEGYFVGYSMSSKAFRVFNKRTKKVEENLHVDFLENKLIEKGAGPNWLFDIDTLTNFMNYVPVVVA